MQLTAKSDTSDGNSVCTSCVLQSDELVFVITAPQSFANAQPGTSAIPGYDAERAFDFFKKHGLAVRAIGTLREGLPAMMVPDFSGHMGPGIRPTRAIRQLSYEQMHKCQLDIRIALQSANLSCVQASESKMQ